MTREGLDSLDKETLICLVLTQAETIAALTKQCETLLARVAELEAKLGATAFSLIGCGLDRRYL